MSRKTSTYARKRRFAGAHERLDPITVSRLNGTRLTADELDKIHGPIRQAFVQARRGAMTREDWVFLCTGVHKAMAIDDAGIFRGLRSMIDAADEALHAIGERASADGPWRPPTLYAPEIRVLDDLVWAYRTMLLEVTYAEFVRAERLAIARVASAGGEVLHQAEASA